MDILRQVARQWQDLLTGNEERAQEIIQREYAPVITLARGITPYSDVPYASIEEVRGCPPEMFLPGLERKKYDDVGTLSESVYGGEQAFLNVLEQDEFFTLRPECIDELLVGLRAVQDQVFETLARIGGTDAWIRPRYENGVVDTRNMPVYHLALTCCIKNLSPQEQQKIVQEMYPIS